MGIIKNLINRIEHDKTEAEDLCDTIDSYCTSVEQLFISMTEFIDPSFDDEVRSRCSDFDKKIKAVGVGKVFCSSQLNTRKKLLQALRDGLPFRISQHNDEVAAVFEENVRKLIGRVEGRQLDDQQIRCIIKDSSNHLIIAGAGTGKTTTIVGKVKYLLKSGACEAKDILVLSFTNASASEMRERIVKEAGEEIEASTFHKLGMNIINSVEGITPKITKIQLPRFVREQLSECINKPEYLGLLCRYLLFNYKYAKSEFDFRSGAEYDDYLRMNPPVTLKGDKVKSYGEMDIANFLFSNGISYEYEREYQTETRTGDRAQYYPDFYLPEYGYYIEFFGINEKGEVPAYFRSRDGKTPAEEYQEGMRWKRELHKANNTVLIECYSYERSKGVLLSSLEEKLRKLNVVFKPLSAKEIWAKVSKNNSKDLLTGIAELIATVISLMKSNELDIKELKNFCLKDHRMGGSSLVDLIAPVYYAYVSLLDHNGEIDFNDMINKATHIINEGKYVNPYKYVIVDEYQDISKSRFCLLKALRQSSDYKLFCVGDDWQSIYRFAGSDMDYIINFAKYWGATEYSKIETTYRFTDSLIRISGGFIMRNPSQIRKEIKGIKSSTGFAMGEVKGYTEELAVRFMLNRLREFPKNSTVFFVGRYTFDSRLLSDCPELECRYDTVTQAARVILNDRKDLKMEFLTAHRSKGLQADYVFIINNKDRGMGFPSKIQNDPLVDRLLECREDYPYAEERRLFYVALTRARIRSYLVVVNGNESEFVSEMEKQYAPEMKKEAFTCPLCGGSLEKKNGPYGEFYGCSNYKHTGCTFTRKIRKKDQ
ncbi:MAG: UvrD-helicase domain-containing protein [Lachnospiraceae bacterium]|nr:UvrD-helicase domain-containing protein [Lachnospiraceae bacterium]